jgi:membrane protein DedA with SNARE-associated domain
MLEYSSMHQVFIFIQHFSYLGIFGIAFFSGYIIPMPEEILLLTIGYTASTNYVSLALVIVLVILAFILSDYVVYRLTIGNSKYVEKFIQDVLDVKIVSKNKAWFEKNIGAAIFIFRCIPLMRFVGPVFSGYLKVKDRTFLFFNSLANIVCAPVIILIGFFSRKYTLLLVNHFSHISYPIAKFFFAFVIAFVVIRVAEYIYKKGKTGQKENNII